MDAKDESNDQLVESVRQMPSFEHNQSHIGSDVEQQSTRSSCSEDYIPSMEAADGECENRINALTCESMRRVDVTTTGTFQTKSDSQINKAIKELTSILDMCKQYPQESAAFVESLQAMINTLSEQLNSNSNFVSRQLNERIQKRAIQIHHSNRRICLCK